MRSSMEGPPSKVIAGGGEVFGIEVAVVAVGVFAAGDFVVVFVGGDFVNVDAVLFSAVGSGLVIVVVFCTAVAFVVVAASVAVAVVSGAVVGVVAATFSASAWTLAKVPSKACCIHTGGTGSDPPAVEDSVRPILYIIQVCNATRTETRSSTALENWSSDLLVLHLHTSRP
jgi:hypothetical protein